MANERALAWYHANKHRIDKEARKAYMQEYRSKNPEKWKRTPEQQEEANRRRREKYARDKAHRAEIRAKVREWQLNNPDKRKSQRLKLYGLTLDDFYWMLEIQDYKCAICGYSDMSDPNIFPLVDHCHGTGKVRGLLCLNCNQAIGKLKDDPDRARMAAHYLEVYR